MDESTHLEGELVVLVVIEELQLAIRSGDITHLELLHYAWCAPLETKERWFGGSFYLVVEFQGLDNTAWSFICGVEDEDGICLECNPVRVLVMEILA